ncbi:hypothetical protein MBM_06329 [Drepanopeziza brunnea f. sp. 'multigermtubi' MB_m1]|uniref:Uncharacterized protein n=1 Tax=Marssonina brunnea f. sp. multigermtubi (strain MB_m1) TaxID=1072389 RepID=K1WRQ5_MARBU|nr:uncharacterized protein MBM_06329 [Drepanopeziza brunnea f. sp. 'multigermtubi' MB_m1]EKD15701.1 hypothetical protein MBM_06329 [Drepanopeziza brunnea f. sp. 'multigermtubi' MB_m1]
MPFKQVTQFSKIVKRDRSRLKNPFFALAIAAAATAAAAAAILRTLTFEDSLFLLNFFIKRLLMLTIIKALKCIKCINSKIISKSNRDYYNCDTSVIRCFRCTKSSYSNCTAAFAVANTAFDNFLALNAAFSKGVASNASGLTSRTNRNPVIRSASSILLFPLALALAAFVIPVAFAALVAFIIVAFLALVITLAAFAAALAVVITLAERRAEVKRLLRALIDLLL